ncbi:CFEM domain protein [Ceratobasidium sp. AG-Ba]|nr:CFEM domain protein [Ceratobasidium sp. AG-Ba]
MKYTVLLAAVFVGLAAAQGTSSASAPAPTPSVSACVLDCITQAVLDYTQCVCTNQDFQAAIGECLGNDCTGQQQQEAIDLRAQVCDGISGSATPTLTGSTSGTPVTGSATAPVLSSPSASPTSLSSVSRLSSSSRVSSFASSASSVVNSITSGVASATGSPNAAIGVPSFDFAAAGLWTGIALGGMAVAQLAL